MDTRQAFVFILSAAGEEKEVRALSNALRGLSPYRPCRPGPPPRRLTYNEMLANWFRQLGRKMRVDDQDWQRNWTSQTQETLHSLILIGLIYEILPSEMLSILALFQEHTLEEIRYWIGKWREFRDWGTLSRFMLLNSLPWQDSLSVVYLHRVSPCTRTGLSSQEELLIRKIRDRSSCDKNKLDNKLASNAELRILADYFALCQPGSIPLDMPLKSPSLVHHPWQAQQT
jgi:hypothetical protein